MKVEDTLKTAQLIHTLLNVLPLEFAFNSLIIVKVNNPVTT